MKLKTLEKAAVFLFLFSLTIPLSKPVGGSVWTRVYFWDFSLVALYALWFFRVSLYNQKIQIKTFDIVLFAFICWLLISSLSGPRLNMAFERWFLWFRGFLIYFYFSKNTGKIFSVKFFITALFAIILFEGALCIIQFATQSNFGQINKYFGGKEFADRVRGFYFHGNRYVRSTGTFFNTGIIAEWMVLLLPVLLAAYFYPEKIVSKIALFSFWILGLMSAFLTLSRVEFSSLAIGTFLVLFWFGFFKISKGLGKGHFKFCVFLLVICITGLSVLYANGFLPKIVSRITDFEGRFEKKIAYMESAVEIMEMRPFLGTGLENFGLYFQKTDFPYYHHGEGVVHNIPLLIASETGITGFFLLLTLIALMFLKFLKRIRKPPIGKLALLNGGALIGVVSYFWSMQWGAGLKHHSVMPIFFVVLGTSFLFVKHEENYSSNV